MKTSDNPLICIAIRTYFRAESLFKVLNSILGLNYSKELIKVVVVVDSHDIEALNVIEKFKDSGIRLETITLDINSADRGRNLAIMKCSSEVVAVIDDDIVLHPETVNVALKYLQNERVAAVGFPAVSVRPSLGEKLHHWRFLGLKAVEASTVMPVTFFKKSALLKVGLYREDMGPPLTIHEDWELGSRIRLYGYKVIVSGELQILHLEEKLMSNSDATTLIQCRRTILVHKIRCIVRHMVHYARAYMNKHWWTFFEVLKVSPLLQLLEYVAYYLLPPTTLALLLINPVWGLFLIIAVLIFIELNSFVRGYYRMLSLKERIAYPLLLTLARIVRAYLALIGYLYSKVWIRIRPRG